MAVYYVNAASAGNGTHPASAFPSLSSVPWDNGDIVWVRRTHVECLAHDKHGFAVWSTSSFNRAAFAIGWPDTDYPFFAQRPQAAIDAGWDDDLPSTETYSTFGYKFPTISCSASNVNTNHVIGRNMNVVNFAFNQLAAANVFPGRTLAGARLSNVLAVRSFSVFGAFGANAFANQECEKIILPLSVTNASPFDTNDDIVLGHVILPVQTVLGLPGFFNQDGNSRIELLENQSNSVTVILGNAVGALFTEQAMIHRVIGIKPWVDVATGQSANANRPLAVIDDYYGEGPIFWNGGGKASVFRCTSAEALHNSDRVSRFFVQSVAAAVQGLADGSISNWPLMRKYVSVTSGTAITLVVPIYIGTTNVVSASPYQIRAALRARGGGVKPASISAGSYSNWAGTFVSGGSAWLAAFNWTPTETGIVPFDVIMPSPTQATSGAAVQGYALYAEPYSV